MGRTGAYGCGQCLPCRFNRRRVWTHRLMLESSLYKDNCFLTLTYNDDHVPKHLDSYTLKREHLRNFLKRLRKKLEPGKIRFFAVGEYGHGGQRVWNPHYHLALFNYPSCRKWPQKPRGGRSCECVACDFIASVWSDPVTRERRGKVSLDVLAPESASYICGYVVKKLTQPDAKVRVNGTYVGLDGREPEFATMSTKPGIGKDMMHEVASTALTYDATLGDDVPTSLRHGQRLLPLGRYLTRHLRTMVGRAPNAPQATIDKAQEEVQALRKRPDIVEKGGLKEAVIEAGKVKADQLEARLKRKSASRKGGL